MVAPSRPPNLTLANWDLGGPPSAWSYLHAGELLGAAEIPTRGRAAPLDVGELTAAARFPVEPGVALEDYVAEGPVSGIVVVRQGRVVFERYPRMRPDDRHLLMSVSKVFASVLVGILEERGLIDVTAPVEAILPEVAGSGWQGAPVRDVMDMASGIDCPEQGPAAYSDPAHPFYRFEATLGWRPPGAAALPSTYALVATLGARCAPGTQYEYTSVNTFVLSWLVERITGLPYAEVLAREIWAMAGFEAPAQLCCSAGGAPATHGGLSTRLRDLARFGMLFTPSAHRVSDAPVISADHLRRIQTGGRRQIHPDADHPAADVEAAYGSVRPPASRQWDFVTDDGDLYKGGFGGQGLYISPERDVVVAFAGTPLPDGSSNRLRWIGRRLALAIA